MSDKIVYIKKNSGALEPFIFEKLKKSLILSGVTIEQANEIIKCIKPQLYDGISSKAIYKKAFSLIKKHSRVCASKYSLKKAIFDLGPTGYPFEKLVAAWLKNLGYKTEVGVVLKGDCVTHEIDVLAEKDGNTYAIECKFHLTPKSVSNVKIPLYINSRFLDIQKEWNKNNAKTTKLKQGWLVTNTRFTEDAINYGKCAGLTMFSWDYPKKNGLNENIGKLGLYPVTVLTTLKKREKKQLIENDIILIKELSETPSVLNKLGFSSNKIEQTLNEVHTLCSIK